MSEASDEQDEEDDEEAEYVEKDSPRRSRNTANGPTRRKKHSILSDHDGSADDDSGELTKGSSKSKRMKQGTGKSSERSRGPKGAKGAKSAKSATGSRTNEVKDEDTGAVSAGKRKSTAQSILTPEDESGSDDGTLRDGDKVGKTCLTGRELDKLG